MPSEQLGQQDLDSLSAWMNPIYLDTAKMQALSEQFLDSSSLQLQNILQPSVYKSLVSAAHEMDAKDGYLASGLPAHGSGVYGPWEVQGSPVSQRFLRLSTKATQSMDQHSQQFAQLQHRFESTAFRHWLTLISQMTLESYRGMVRRFRPGLDYTLASIPIANEDSGLLDVTFSLVSVDDTPSWQTGDVGGYLCYMASDDNDDASVYRSTDQEGALLTLPCCGNELSIVLRDEGVMQFVKYVSAGAIGSRWDMALEFETQDTSALD